MFKKAGTEAGRKRTNPSDRKEPEEGKERSR